MRIFLDTADVESVRRVHDTGLLDGVTTNPSLVAKTGRRMEDIVREICSITSGPVSAEAMSETCEGLLEEAPRIASIAPNVVVKIPAFPEGVKATRILQNEMGVKINMTMVFSAAQAWLAMKAGAHFVSIVLSRLDACGSESDILVNDSVVIKQNYGYKTDILAGSLKTQNHVLACLRAGVDIATIPESLFDSLFLHPLTDAAMEQFRRDAARTK